MLTIGLGPAFVGSGGGGGAQSVFKLAFVETTATAKVTDTSITDFPLVDTSMLSTMSEMFRGCSNLKTIPQLDTSKATTMYRMFYNCSKLESIPLLDTANVTNMDYMFYYTNIKSVPLLDMSNVTTAKNMFSNSAIEHVPELDVSNIGSSGMSSFFSNAYSLKTCLLIGLRETLEIHYSSSLEKDSVLHIFNHAQTVSAAKTIKLHKNVFNQLTADEIAIATQKGFSVVST